MPDSHSSSHWIRDSVENQVFPLRKGVFSFSYAPYMRTEARGNSNWLQNPNSEADPDLVVAGAVLVSVAECWVVHDVAPELWVALEDVCDEVAAEAAGARAVTVVWLFRVVWVEVWPGSGVVASVCRVVPAVSVLLLVTAEFVFCKREHEFASHKRCDKSQWLIFFSHHHILYCCILCL